MTATWADRHTHPTLPFRPRCLSRRCPLCAVRFVFTVGDQALQRAEVDGVHLLAITLLLFRFEVHREVLETHVIQEPAEGFEAELAFADVLVPVHAAAKLLLAVVEMQCPDALETDGLVDPADGGFEFVV